MTTYRERLERATQKRVDKAAQQRWNAVYGAMMAQQCHEYFRQGRGGVTEEAMLSFTDEAVTIADMAEEAWNTRELEGG